MIRAQIQFEEAVYEHVRRLAHRKRISIAEAVRRLVDRGLRAGDESDAPPRASALLELAGVADSGLGDLGRHHDRYLAEDDG